MHEWSWVSWIFCPASSLMTQTKTSCLTTAFFKIPSPIFVFAVSVSSLTPRAETNFKSMKGLNKVKADERRKLKERTEARVAQLERQQARQDWAEVLNLCALLWVALIVCFYARLYLSQYSAR